ncbi:MAG: AAA family ATPase, partial [candidate division Zixibacteria bacterium]|nr:AAA family ATPase [candidate division Zixibacteria bacterium]
MSYYKILGFEKEPFSTSPDPEFFYLTKEHEAALTHTLIELRLKRGLSVILGDVGTGKTTLSRKLIQELKGRDDFIFNIVLDPSFENEHLFLTSLARNFEIELGNTTSPTILDLRESLERFLFQKSVTENKIVTLIIDEAQKLSESSLEILRVILNYETNEYKLLQLVLLGQLELHSKIVSMPNFYDRISFKYTLNPLDFDETRDMIEFRIRQAGYKAKMHLFLDDAIQEIYQYSRGYPRQITMLCHKVLKSLVMNNKAVVDGELVREITEDEIKTGWHRKDPLLQKNSY